MQTAPGILLCSSGRGKQHPYPSIAEETRYQIKVEMALVLASDSRFPVEHAVQ